MGESTPTPSRVIVLNTLGAALHHYGSELTSVLEATAHDVEVISITEPSSSGRGGRAWLGDYVSALRTARRSADRRTVLIVTWPVLGFVDVVVVGLVYGRNAVVVVHDTRPLTRAVGYARVWQWVAAVLSRRVSVLLHSDEALADVASSRLRRSALVVPHPMHAPRARRSRYAGGHDAPVVRVLGQYKRDRDVDGLREIARQLSPDHRLEIVGRRWPEVEGWSVRDAFVSEAELSELIATSDAVIIPYRRFYQSGIAIRCLEQSVPVVGPARSSLATLCGRGSRLLVDENRSWSEAVRHATSPRGQAEAGRISGDWRTHAVDRWRRFRLRPPGGDATNTAPDTAPDPEWIRTA